MRISHYKLCMDYYRKHLLFERISPETMNLDDDGNLLVHIIHEYKDDSYKVVTEREMRCIDSVLPISWVASYWINVFNGDVMDAA